MIAKAFLTTAVAIVAIFGAAIDAYAQPAVTASPSPQPSDPCGGPSRLLATANRPTIGYSACAVKAHTAVFELGYQNQSMGTARAGSIQSQVPQNFLRLGVAPRFEFDVIGPNYESTRTFAMGHADVIAHGVADYGFGFKYEISPTGKWTTAFDGLYTGPNGSPMFSAGYATLTTNFDASFAMSPATSLGTTVAVSSTGGHAGNDRGRYGVVTPSFVITTQIPHEFQFYAEYVYVSKIALNRGARAFTDFGVQKLLGSRTEIDVEYGHAIIGTAALKFDYIGAGTVVQLW